MFIYLLTFALKRFNHIISNKIFINKYFWSSLNPLKVTFLPRIFIVGINIYLKCKLSIYISDSGCLAENWIENLGKDDV